MSNTAIRVFKYRLCPSRSQEKNLFRVLNCARNLYNTALAERKFGYEIEGRSVSNAALETRARHPALRASKDATAFTAFCSSNTGAAHGSTASG